MGRPGPNHSLDLAHIANSSLSSKKAEDFGTGTAKIHEEVRRKLEESNKKNMQAANVHLKVKTFNEGDLLCVYLKKERFPSGSYSKLKEKKIDPCRILKKMNYNACKIELSPNVSTHPTFNVLDLSTYHGELDSNSWVSSPSPEENDVVPSKPFHSYVDE